MKNKIVFTVLISFAFFCFFNAASADTTIHLDIKTPTNTIYDQDITVAPCDSDNAGTLKITAYCAIRQSGIQNDWNWAWAPGAFLNSLDNIAGYTSKDRNNNDVYHYWSWSLNGVEGTMGLNLYELQPNDLISLNFIDPIDETPVTSAGSGPLVDSSSTTPTVSSTLTPASVIKPTFDLKKAADFLIGEQKSDGSFGEDLYTDWTAVALASGNNQDSVLKLVKYFGESKINSTLLTDYERRAMALMSLGLNPYDLNGENYIEKITNSFDGKQFGDVNEDNDDIFALIVLQNSGYTQNDQMISDDINFILGKQRTDGSWDGSPDMTGAGIEALSFFNQNTEVKNALIKAENFLRLSQKNDGGWGNASSTAWAMEGILSLGEKPEDWVSYSNIPLDYLTLNQDTDGGIKDENMQNKIWETAYVVSALSGKTWNQIMQKFDKPQPVIIVKIPAEIVKKPETKTVTVKNNSIASVSSIKNTKPKLENSVIKNTATVLNAVTDLPASVKTETPKANWFVRFLKNIFGF